MVKTGDIRPEQATAEYLRRLEQEHHRFLGAGGMPRPAFAVRVDCPVCGRADRVAYDPDAEPSYQLCRPCGCVYADPRLSAEAIDDFVRHSDALNFFHEHILLATAARRRDGIFRPRLERLRREVPAGRVLELGSAVGTFLGLLAEAGYEGEGVELCTFSVEHSRRLGYRVHDRVLEELDLPARSFDAVCAWAVFCHLATPRETAAAVFSVLRPGGFLAATMTNCLSFEYLTLRARHPFKNPLVCYQSYTPEGARRLLARAGFVDVVVQTPGQTDVQMVRDVLGRPDPALGHFLNHVLFDDSPGADERRDDLQQLIASQQMSGHMVVTARKPDS